MSNIIPTDINSTTNKVIQFNSKIVPWAINVDEIIHDTNTNNRNRDYSDSVSNKLKILSKQNDIDISSAKNLNLTASNKIILNSETSFNNLATFTSIKTNDISCNNIIYSNKINNLNTNLDIFSTSENNIDISSANNLNLTASNKIILNSESSFNNLAKFTDVSINNLSINNQLQINDTIIKSDTITLNPGLNNDLNLFNKFKFKLEQDIDKYNIILEATQENSGGAFILSTLTEAIATISGETHNNSKINTSKINSSVIGLIQPAQAKFTDVSINNLTISNDLFINELSLNTLKSYEIYLNNTYRSSSDNSINLIIELSNIDSSLTQLDTDISNLDTSMISKFQITDASVNILEEKLDNFILDDASFGTIDISKNIKLEYINNNHSLLFVDNNKNLSSNNFIHFNEVSGIMFFDNSLAMKIPHSIQNTNTDISGLIRYNPDRNKFEGYNGTQWNKFLDTTNNKVDILDNGDISLNKIYLYHDTGDISSSNIYCIDISCIDISASNISCIDISASNISCIDISASNISCIDISCIDISSSNISCIDISSSNISCIDISCIDISCIDISSSNIYSINLYNNYIDTSDILIKNDLSINNTLHINNHIIKNDNIDNFLVIDPQPTNNDKGTLRIKGNLIVDGSQTIIYSTRLDISDTNINLGINAATKSDLNDAGIDISNVATFRYNNDKWNTNIGLNVSGDLDVSNINVNNNLTVTNDINSKNLTVTNDINTENITVTNDISVNNIIGTNIKINNFNSSDKYVTFQDNLLTIDAFNQSYIVDNIDNIDNIEGNRNINDISCINFINGTQSIIEISSNFNINIIGSESMDKDNYYFNYASDLLLEAGNKAILCISKINDNHYISCSIYSK